MAAETAQRTAALAAAAEGADWVLQIDADEVLPDRDALVAALRTAEELGLPALEWPMRVPSEASETDLPRSVQRRRRRRSALRGGSPRAPARRFMINPRSARRSCAQSAGVTTAASR